MAAFSLSSYTVSTLQCYCDISELEIKNVQGSSLPGNTLGFPSNWWDKQLNSELGPVPLAPLLIFLLASASGTGRSKTSNTEGSKLDMVRMKTDTQSLKARAKGSMSARNGKKEGWTREGTMGGQDWNRKNNSEKMMRITSRGVKLSWKKKKKNQHLGSQKSKGDWLWWVDGKGKENGSHRSWAWAVKWEKYRLGKEHRTKSRERRQTGQKSQCPLEHNCLWEWLKVLGTCHSPVSANTCEALW